LGGINMNRDVKEKIKLLRNMCGKGNKQEYIENLYSDLVDKTWWSDTKTTGDGERENFLYEAFFQYYDIINNEEFREVESDEKLKYHLINLCRIQLSKELNRVSNGDYIRKDE
jgi:hypothetical protein